ncbi:hypothetical protein E2C01_097508 [Portunus trituberculatus]|uniref:Uncharacterized protein n=1 Tax=Portunus trituberculatus TaxID=210409 RepID=A0A5B7K503_PORTR|nr:hypothetical protein [Portunus trituberculatus]
MLRRLLTRSHANPPPTPSTPQHILDAHGCLMHFSHPSPQIPSSPLARPPPPPRFLCHSSQPCVTRPAPPVLLPCPYLAVLSPHQPCP